LAGLIILWFVGIAVSENAQNARELSRMLGWAIDAYAAALVFLWWLIWRYNHRVFPVQRRSWDRSFMCRRCGKTMQLDALTRGGEE